MHRTKNMFPLNTDRQARGCGRKSLFLPVLVWLTVCLSAHAAQLPLHSQRLTVGNEIWNLQVPSGMQLELLTTDLDKPRLMVFLPNSDLLIGSKSGNIYRLEPPYREPQVLVDLPGYPHSLAYRDGELLIAQSDGLYRAEYRPGQRRIDRNELKLLVPLPTGGGHSSRSVAVGPDQRVYVSLGISGNCSNEYLDEAYPIDDRRGGVLVLDESGPRVRFIPFASGLRNPVGFDWHPQTGELYASNNGPDHLGFDQPPEYFFRLTPGSFHGMPWYRFDGRRLHRDNCIEVKPPRPASDVGVPVATFPSRNAPMGVGFVPSGALDPRFEHNAIVAFRGSWGTRPDGGFRGDPASRRPPRLMMVRFEDGKAAEVMDVIRGFQRTDGRRLAQPVGVAIGPDGALYFTSDSQTGGLFRLSPG
ncbi:MAG: PQQ-dependent sugar dehydrogenase [Thiogranum sp.]